MSYLLTAITAVILLLTLLPISKAPQWWVRTWDFPRLQIAAIAALNAAALLYWLPLTQPQGWILLLCNLSCLLYQLYWIIPYTPLGKRQVIRHRGDDPAPRLRVLVSNVLTPNRHSGRLIDAIREHAPDLVVTLESDHWWEQQLAPIEKVYPHVIRCPQDNLYGMHVYSRLPLHDVETQFLVDPEIPSMHFLLKLDQGHDVRMHCLHPTPPSPTENDESSERDAELVMVGRSVADSDQPVVVTGDMNDVAWSATTRLFLKISGLLDPRRGRGMLSTYHAQWPFLRWPLDHVFHSDHFLLGFMRRLPSIGSDHFPILFELVFKPSVGAQQESLEKTADDEQEAAEKLAEVGAAPSEVHTPGE